MRKHKYLTDPTTTADESGYRVEEGIVIDPTDDPSTCRAYDEWTRFWRRSKEDLRAEEAAWAARSGPVTVRKIGEEVG